MTMFHCEMNRHNDEDLAKIANGPIDECLEGKRDIASAGSASRRAIYEMALAVAAQHIRHHADLVAGLPVREVTTLTIVDLLCRIANEIDPEVNAEKLSLFTNDFDTVVAIDTDDALRVLEEHSGARIVIEVGEAEYWRLIPDDKEITIWCEAGTDKPGFIMEGVPVTKTAREWAQRGRGYLSCLEQ